MNEGVRRLTTPVFHSGTGGAAPGSSTAVQNAQRRAAAGTGLRHSGHSRVAGGAGAAARAGSPGAARRRSTPRRPPAGRLPGLEKVAAGEAAATEGEAQGGDIGPADQSGHQRHQPIAREGGHQAGTGAAAGDANGHVHHVAAEDQVADFVFRSSTRTVARRSSGSLWSPRAAISSGPTQQLRNGGSMGAGWGTPQCSSTMKPRNRR